MSRMNSSADVLDGFAAALSAHGLAPDEIVADGVLHRFDSPEEKRGKGSGWYVLHGDGLSAGAFGDWRTGLSATWCAQPNRSLSDAERQAQRQRFEQAKADAAKVRGIAAEEARAQCGTLWAKAGPIHPDHRYVVSKHIQPVNVRELHDALVVPLADIDGHLRSLQFITPGGTKRFKSRACVAGYFCLLGSMSGGNRLLVAEGCATGCTPARSHGRPGRVCHERRESADGGEGAARQVPRYRCRCRC